MSTRPAPSNTMHITCLNCNQIYSQSRQPKVLPCGHSLCSFCVFEDSDRNGYYYCYDCHCRFQIIQQYSPPTNLLFFHMMDKMQEFTRLKQWESGPNKQLDTINDRLSLLSIEQQCLYTFCQRKKYERDGYLEMFCSQECKLNHEKLDNP